LCFIFKYTCLVHKQLVYPVFWMEQIILVGMHLFNYINIDCIHIGNIISP
jgi:hypothetical protein